MAIFDVALLAPAILLACAALCFSNPGRRPKRVLRLTEGGALAALTAAVIALVVLMTEGSGVGSLLGFDGIGLSVRLDVT